MSHLVRTIDPTQDERWDPFVLRHRSSSIYHHSAWAEVIQRSYGYVPRYLVLEGEDGAIRAGIPCFRIRSALTGIRMVCLPFSDHCDPLVDCGSELQAILPVLMKRCRSERCSYLEIRGASDGEVLLDSGFQRDRVFSIL